MSKNKFIRKDNVKHTSIFRILFLTLFILIIFSLYVYNLSRLQIKESKEYLKKSENLMNKTYNVKPKRGEIYDRNGEILAQNKQNYFSLYITPKGIDKSELENELKEISSILKTPYEDLKKKIDNIKDINTYYQEIMLFQFLTQQQLFSVLERADRLKGLSFKTNTIREYPKNKLFSHIVGFIGKIQESEVRYFFNQGYDSNSVIGKSGVEQQYEYLLKGQEGKYVKQINAQGKSVNEDYYREIVRSKDGYKLVLSLDARYQELAKKALGKRSGAIVLLKPSTGEVLAMYSYPDFDPNIFYKGANSDNIESLFSKNDSPLFNRAIQSVSPPASTYKILMSLAMLNENVFSKDATVFDPGYLKIGNRTFHNYERVGHGQVNLNDALKYSDNVYFYTIGTKYLGVDKINYYSDMLGLGKPTMIDLPSEAVGLVPSKKWKERNLRTQWFLGDTANLSIGQGYLGTTPIQMANVVSLLVNEGFVYKPKILKEIRNYSDFSLENTIESEILYKTDIRRDAFVEVKNGLRTAVLSGSAAPAITTRKVQIAGKTGTGESSYGEDHKYSWFASFAPYDAPKEQQLAMVVWVDAKNDWDWWAPKATNIIYHGIYSNMNYEDAVADLMPNWYLPDSLGYEDSNEIIKENAKEKMRYYYPAPVVNDESTKPETQD